MCLDCKGRLLNPSQEIVIKEEEDMEEGEEGEGWKQGRDDGTRTNAASEKVSWLYWMQNNVCDQMLRHCLSYV